MYQMMKRNIIICLLTVSLGLTMASKSASGAQTPEEFYRGKTLRWVGASPGDSPDLMARTITPFLAKDIGVRIIIENKKSDEVMNYVYKEGTRDGLTLGIRDTDSIIYNDILKAPGVHYESDKFNFVADVYPTIKTFQSSPKLPYKTLDALRKAKGLKAGATSAKGSLAVSSAVMFEILGLDGKVITGFKQKKDLALAIARGEIDFMVTSDKGAMKDEKDGFIVNLFAVGNKRSVAVPHAPSLLSELGVKVPREMEAVYKVIINAGTAVVLPPGVPRERVDYLRKEFQALSNNMELQKELERLTGDRRPFVSGQELQEEMSEIKSDKELANKLNAIFKKYTAVQ